MDAIDQSICAVIRRMGDPSLNDIMHAKETEPYTQHTITHHVKDLCRRGLVRQRDDDQEHDWTYRLSFSTLAPVEKG